MCFYLLRQNLKGGGGDIFSGVVCQLKSPKLGQLSETFMKEEKKYV